MYIGQKKMDDIKADEIQIGGEHYKKYGKLQPWTVVLAWNLG